MMPTPEMKAAAILIVDDEAANVELLESFLRAEGYLNLTGTTDSREALRLYESVTPDLVLLDLHMPHFSGFEIMRELLARVSPDDYVPILVLTADVNASARERALAEGAKDFLTKPLDQIEVLQRIRNLLETRLLFQKARQATRARDEVLAVVAHDLRNPLGTIRLAASMMLESDPAPPHRRPVEIIEAAAERMNALIADLLEIRRLESGKLRLELRRLDPGLLLKEAVAMLRPLAGARSIEIALDAPVELPAVMMDPDRILQVLSNLVGNAIKFTPRGGTIRLECESSSGIVRFAVRDSGPGIPADQLPYLFGEYWQADDRDRRGIGLGLSIARGLVEAHGGEIWAESEPGAGAAFLFTIPAAPAPRERTVAEPLVSLTLT